MTKAREDGIARSLKRLGFQLGKGRGKAFKITVGGRQHCAQHRGT